MKKFHIAISTDKIADTIADYSIRLGRPPCSQVDGEYALWRTETLNFSIRHDEHCASGELRHLGWEQDDAEQFSVETDVNGIKWERFSADQQADEINQFWPQANYQVGAE